MNKTSKITWLDLYNYLNAQANGLDNIGKFEWEAPVIVHDAETGDEYNCDTWMISDDKNNEKLVLMINTADEAISRFINDICRD